MGLAGQERHEATTDCPPIPPYDALPVIVQKYCVYKHDDREIINAGGRAPSYHQGREIPYRVRNGLIAVNTFLVE